MMKRLLLASVLATAPYVVHAQDVVVLALTCTLTKGEPKISGEIKNISSRSLSHVRIGPTFRDENGSFVGKGIAMADFDPILPGQTSTFDGFDGRNPVITRVTIAPYLLLGGALASSGISSAVCLSSK